MSKLKSHYEAAIKAGEIIDSSRQREVLEALQTISDAVDASHKKKHWWSWKAENPKGLYVYGPVGAGKTYLMNLFYAHLPEAHKKRLHFHHFMQQVDKALRAHQGDKNPLKIIAKELAQEAHVLCLDEFLVEDVADASILAEVLRALFAEGIVLVATANTKPDDLYLNGLHRERFLPAIELIKAHTDVMYLDDHRDYRVGREALPEAYLYPVTADNEALMQQQFLKLSGEAEQTTGVVNIQHRDVAYLGCGKRTIWFDFSVICNMPRSQLDYLELAAQFDIVCVSHVPALGANQPAETVLFIRFVDVMYDEGVHLILLADVPQEAIYLEGPMSKMFERTLSRLREMQSADYWQRGRILDQKADYP